MKLKNLPKNKPSNFEIVYIMEKDGLFYTMQLALSKNAASLQKQTSPIDCTFSLTLQKCGNSPILDFW